MNELSNFELILNLSEVQTYLLDLSESSVHVSGDYGVTQEKFQEFLANLHLFIFQDKAFPFFV